jgi:hypothetical protein
MRVSAMSKPRSMSVTAQGDKSASLAAQPQGRHPTLRNECVDYPDTYKHACMFIRGLAD